MYEFDPCELFAENGDLLAAGSVVECENGRLRISLEDSDSLHTGQVNRILILNNFLGECLYEATLEELPQGGAFYTQLRFMGSHQRRENTRVTCHLKSSIRGKFEDGNLTAFEKPLEITILNISAQGMLISCLENLPIGLTFPFDFSETVPAIHMTVRTVRRETGGHGYRYGCTFDITQREMDRLYRFVLQKQIEQRRNRVNF